MYKCISIHIHVHVIEQRDYTSISMLNTHIHVQKYVTNTRISVAVVYRSLLVDIKWPVSSHTAWWDISLVQLFLVIMRQKSPQKIEFFSFQIIPMWYYNGRTNWMAVQRLGNYWYTSARATRNSLCLVQIHIPVYCTVICENFVVEIIRFMQNYLHKIFFTY